MATPSPLGLCLPIAQLGTGPDGTAVLASEPDTGRFLELRHLTRAPFGSARWAAIETRLRACALAEHPALRRVVAIDRSGAAPVLALSWPEGRTLEERLAEGLLPPDSALGIAAARLGLLSLAWDVICPLCRVPSTTVSTLREIEDHASCPACGVDFSLDFARSIELVLQAAPATRKSERALYCLGGPFLFPHVAAQLRLAPGERVVLPLTLEIGQHRVRSPQLTTAMELRVSPLGTAQRASICFEAGAPLPPAHLLPGAQWLDLRNALDDELVIRVERLAQRAGARRPR